MNALFGGVFYTEALEQSPDNITFNDSGDNLRIKALGLRAVAQYEDFFLRVGINGRLTLAAQHGEGTGTQKQVGKVGAVHAQKRGCFVPNVETFLSENEIVDDLQRRCLPRLMS
jgi:hypothetical protein